MVLRYSSGKIIAKLDRSTKTLVDDVSFSIEKGKILAVIGETGAGKTIIANSIMGLLPKNVSAKGLSVELSGEINANTKKLLGKGIVYIPQSAKDSLNPTRKIGAQIADGLKPAGVKRSDLQSAVQEKLHIVELDEKLANEYPSALSGGMAGKVVVAMATSSSPTLVIADELTSGMDEKSKSECLTLVKTLFKDSAILLITHDLSVAEIADDVLVLSDGKALEYGSATAVLKTPAHPYTRALISALPENGLTAHPIIRKGESDCPHYDRCEYASENCKGEITVKNVNGIAVRCNNVEI